jgi:glycine cleavage system protein P-like pyridoxal-binding family
MVASSSDELPTEDVIDAGWRAPLFMAVKAADILRRTNIMPLVSKGELKLEHLQTPAIEGKILLQALLLDSAMVPLGSCTHAINQ